MSQFGFSLQLLITSRKKICTMVFTDKVIIITGASSGIGAKIAEHLSELGAKVVITGRNEKNLRETADKCVGETLMIVTDVNSENDRKKIVDDTIAKFGRIDVLVNNAGMGAAGEVLNFPMEKFDEIFNTNVRSVFHLTQLSVPHLIQSKGNIVNISSVTGLRAFGGFTAYCMSKAAVDQFTRCVALELAPKGVRVNSVNPAVILTDFQKRMGLKGEAYEAYVKRADETHALGRPGTVEEVANAVAFLADNETASFIAGSNLAVDGGRAIMCPR